MMLQLSFITTTKHQIKQDDTTKSIEKLKDILVVIKRQKLTQTTLAKNFYRMYKYLYIQAASGSRAEDMLRSMHLVVYDKELKKTLLKMSAMISQSNDVHKSLLYLRSQFKNDDGDVLISILESIAISGLSKDAFLRLDHMLFQKYLSQLRKDTQKIKQTYFISVVFFVIAASGVILVPLMDQMLLSANIIFK
ncbi:hypothetical protein QE109_13665 [Fusibacter bizertensis]|jgi:hypothetical protein|uniref:Type II secretion system protein GspF domain-containing protein n=1 Tax=Fusibacter bizertensis TaxID=1488331 RepID=A0ABT6NFJ4_9FIRM|nr:hypothetical protein [Fusibacter bizertensis]MDH8679199.1 hypothetical protein [Fusibacter bizertensis]